MEINEQKRLAFELLEQLNEWRPTILAGGAPRDWDFGEKANDLDFFVLEDFDPIEVEGNLNVTLEKMSEGYADASFEAYTFRIGEQEIQVVRHRGASSPEDVIKSFGCTLSKIWYEGGGILCKDPWYTLNKDFGVGIVSFGATDKFSDKCCNIFREKGMRMATSPSSALKVIGESIEMR